MEPVDPRDRGRHVPHLVRVDGQAHVGADGLARQSEPAQVVVEVAADLELDLPEALDLRLLLGERHHLLVRVAQPSGRGRIARIAVLEQVGDALLPACPPGLEDRDGLVRGERVAHIAEVERGDELLGLHVGEQAPQRLAGALGLDVPQGRQHGADRHVLDALFGAEPAQLGIVHEQVPRALHVRDAVVGVGMRLDVGGRVVRVGVHRVRSGQRHRCGETKVEGLYCGDHAHGLAPLPDTYCSPA